MKTQRRLDFLAAAIVLLSIGAISVVVSCSREVAPATIAASGPTGPIFTPTPAPVLYEAFDGVPLSPNGNCWVSNNPCPNAGGSDLYIADLYNSHSATVTMTINTSIFKSAPNSEQAAIVFSSSGGAVLGAWGTSSEYGSGCGGALTIPATHTLATSTLSFWLYPVTQDGAAMSFIELMYINGHYFYYQNGTGSNVQFSIPSGQWTQMTFPLDATKWSGASAMPANGTPWNVTYIETWVLYGAGPAPYTINVSMDDYYFNP